MSRLSTSLFGRILGGTDKTTTESGISISVDKNVIKQLFLLEDSDGTRFDTCLAISGSQLLHISLTEDKPLLQKFDFATAI